MLYVGLQSCQVVQNFRILYRKSAVVTDITELSGNQPLLRTLQNCPDVSRCYGRYGIAEIVTAIEIDL